MTLTDFLLNTKSSVAELELIEISHTDFSSSYYYVRNHTDGVTVTLEGVLGSRAFTYCPMQITEISAQGDLDFALRIQLGDLGEDLAAELDAVVTADGMSEEPQLIYRTYQSDDLTAPMVGPITLNVKKMAFNEDGVEFEAIADRANSQRTGEVYSANRFPMLRPFLKD